MSSLRNSKAGTRKCPGMWWGEWRSIWNQRSWVLHAALPLTGHMTIHLQLDLQTDLQTLNNKIMLPSSPSWWEDGNQMRESVQKLLKKKNKPSINSTWNVVGVSHSVVSDCLQLHGLKPSRLFCPWDFPDKNTGVDCHFFFSPEDLPDAEIEPMSSALAGGFFTTESLRKSQLKYWYY